MTVGDKIKKARQAKNWTQNELATIVSLPVSRIQQYEANIRNPKPVQLESFANALGVSIEYLQDHNMNSYNDVKHVLLELEDTFKLSVTKLDDQVCITFDDRELSDFLVDWINHKEDSNLSTKTLREYENWKITYPNELLDKTESKLKEKRKQESKQ